MASTSSQSSASTRVFGIFELAEQILLSLSVKDLLINAQRVSKNWKTVIDGSSPLQQALFFKPIGDVILSRSSKTIVIGKDKPWEMVIDETIWIDSSSTAPRERAVVENPLLSSNIVYFSKAPPLASASCTRMFVTQPPVDEVKTEAFGESFEDEAGVKLGYTFEGREGRYWGQVNPVREYSWKKVVLAEDVLRFESGE